MRKKKPTSNEQIPDKDFDDIDSTPLKGYLGNNRLKKSGEVIKWTPKLLEEYHRCSQDILYFAEKYYKIVSIDEGLIKIPLYDYQKNLLGEYQKNRFCAVLQCRQSGKCHFKDTKYTVRNKKTGVIKYVTSQEFHEMQRVSRKN